MSRRLNRVEEACKEELSEMLQREVKDPRVGFVTITRVKLSADLKHARVYFSVIGTEEEAERSMEGLNSAGGYLRRRLGENLRLKYLPELNFVRERVAEEALQLERIMKRVHVEEEEDEGVEP